jgi:hypothetical protein
MPNAGKWPIDYDFVGVSSGFHRGFAGVFRYYSGLWFGRSLFVPKKRLIEQIHGCPEAGFRFTISQLATDRIAVTGFDKLNGNVWKAAK